MLLPLPDPAPTNYPSFAETSPTYTEFLPSPHPASPLPLVLTVVPFYSLLRIVCSFFFCLIAFFIAIASRFAESTRPIPPVPFQSHQSAILTTLLRPPPEDTDRPSLRPQFTRLSTTPTRLSYHVLPLLRPPPVGGFARPPVAIPGIHLPPPDAGFETISRPPFSCVLPNQSVDGFIFGVVREQNPDNDVGIAAGFCRETGDFGRRSPQAGRPVPSRVSFFSFLLLLYRFFEYLCAHVPPPCRCSNCRFSLHTGLVN